MHSLLCQPHSLGRATRWPEGVINGTALANFLPQQIGFPDQTVPVSMKFVPDFSIQFAGVREPPNVHLLKRRIEGAEIL